MEEEVEVVEVLLVDVTDVLLLVVDFEVVVAVGFIVDVGVLTVVVMSLFNVLVVVLHVGLMFFFEHEEVPWRVEVYVWPLLVDLLVQLHDVTVVCVVVVITVGAGIAAANLRRQTNNSSRGSDNIFKERNRYRCCKYVHNQNIYMYMYLSLQKKGMICTITV